MEPPTTGAECQHFDAVQWNPFNRVVQCHVCGVVYIPVDRLSPPAAYWIDDTYQHAEPA